MAVKKVAGTKRHVVDVRYDKTKWVVRVNGCILDSQKSQKEAIWVSGIYIRDIVEFGQKVEFVVFSKLGRVRRKDSFPRSSDPRETKG